MGYLGDGYLSDSAPQYTLPVQVSETDYVEPIVVTVGQESIATGTKSVLAPNSPPVLVGTVMTGPDSSGLLALAAGLFFIGRKSKKRRR